MTDTTHEALTPARGGIRWGIVVLYGFLAEILLIVLFVAATALLGERGGQYAVPVLSLGAVFLFGWLASRKNGSHPVLQGALVGLAAVVVYFAIVMVGTALAAMAGQEPMTAEPPPYVYAIAHVLKVLGGAAGGFVAPRRAP